MAAVTPKNIEYLLLLLIGSQLQADFLEEGHLVEVFLVASLALPPLTQKRTQDPHLLFTIFVEIELKSFTCPYC